MTRIDDALLRRWPLPYPAEDGDKEARGRILVIAGSREMPGAALLAATAALRAGAGKLAIATVASVAAGIALAIPEARVIALEETTAGGVRQASSALHDASSRADAVVIGPGMVDEVSACALVHALMPSFGNARVLLDALAMAACTSNGALPCPVAITPHAGELARLLGIDKSALLNAGAEVASEAARVWNAVVALKGAETFIAAPDGRQWEHRGGNIGLATSGSGDALAGIAGGLLARGATLEQACAWAVALHARAGERLAARSGTLGYLVRDIAAEIPPLLQELGPAGR